jgi:hypothetical protein
VTEVDVAKEELMSKEIEYDAQDEFVNMSRRKLSQLKMRASEMSLADVDWTNLSICGAVN